MRKEEIVERLSRLSEEELNQMIDIYRKHKPRVMEGMQVIFIPESIKSRLSTYGDRDVNQIIKDLPTHLTKVESPSKAYAMKCKQIYIDNCYCFDEVGELFVQKALEYAATYKTRPIILHGSPGCGKSHRASVLAKMIGIPYERADIPLAAHSTGLSGEGGSYKNASVGIIAKGMIHTKSCNYVLNSEELDKEERTDGRPSFSDQFLKVIDQDATRFRDNRLGFDIDVSHIVYTFTANDVEKINAPMLDRCDVFEIRAPTRLEIEGILRNAIVPNTLNSYKTNNDITFSEEAVEYILSSLWRGTGTSVRQYQSLVSKCVGAANYTCIYEERSVSIEKADVEAQLRNMTFDTVNKNKIGFN